MVECGSVGIGSDVVIVGAAVEIGRKKKSVDPFSMTAGSEVSGVVW
jgi:hypothetical protein